MVKDNRPEKCMYCDDGWETHCERCGRTTDEEFEKNGESVAVIVMLKPKKKAKVTRGKILFETPSGVVKYSLTGFLKNGPAVPRSMARDNIKKIKSYIKKGNNVSISSLSGIRVVKK